MPRNVYFSQAVKSEQNLYEDLIIEQLKVFGHEVYYLPRTLVKEDKILGEDVLSTFDDAYAIEMYMEDIEGYGGEKELIAKFGLEIRDEATFIVSRRRWLETVSVDNNLIINTRPNEGDLIYFPRIKKLFEINFVDHDDPFYQVDNLPVYKMSCHLFEDEASLDALFYQMTLETEADYNENMALEDGDLLLEETAGDNLLSETDTGSVGNSLITEYGDYLISESYVIDDIDENANNVFFQDSADSILDFSEGNPFGEPRGGYD